MTQWSYHGAGITNASTSGQALLGGWGVQSQTAGKVVFSSATPLTTGSLTGFHIVGSQVGMGTWHVGSRTGDIDGPLPVELSRFTAQATVDGVRLQWQTLTETNNLGFHLYRSEAKDSEYARVTLTLIKGQGTDSTPHDYSFLDDTAEVGGSYWYLVEDVDFNGVIVQWLTFFLRPRIG